MRCRLRPSPAGGVFAGHAPLPQQLDGLAGDLAGQDPGEPGIRVTGNRRQSYQGAALDFQRFTTPGFDIAGPEQLDQLPIQAHGARRAIGRTRGIPSPPEGV